MSGYHKRDWENFPIEQLKRVNRPTTLVDEEKIQRVRERQAGFCKAAAGDYGPFKRNSGGLFPSIPFPVPAHG